MLSVKTGHTNVDQKCFVINEILLFYLTASPKYVYSPITQMKCVSFVMISDVRALVSFDGLNGYSRLIYIVCISQWDIQTNLYVYP